MEPDDRNEARVPDGWETAVSRSTGKTYFINTITGLPHHRRHCHVLLHRLPRLFPAPCSDQISGPAECWPGARRREPVRVPGRAGEGMAQCKSPTGWRTCLRKHSDRSCAGHSGPEQSLQDSDSGHCAPCAPANGRRTVQMYADETDLEGMMGESAPAADSEPDGGAASGSGEDTPGGAASTAGAAAASTAVVAGGSSSEVEVPAAKTEADKWSCMPIKFYFEPNRTGEAAAQWHCPRCRALVFFRFPSAATCLELGV